jgi:hypothetical protein
MSPHLYRIKRHALYFIQCTAIVEGLDYDNLSVWVPFGKSMSYYALKARDITGFF